MEPALTIAALLSVLGAVGANALFRALGREPPRAPGQAWRDAARACGISDVQVDDRALEGRSGPLRVRLADYGDAVTAGTRITITGLSPHLTVRPEGFGATLDGLRGAKEIVLGDDAFDRIAWVRGDPAQVRALLDVDARRAFIALFERRLERPGASPLWASGQVENGVLTFDAPDEVDGGRGPEAPGVFLAGLYKLPEVLAAGLALARRLLPPDDVAGRLAENLSREPETVVRRLCLATLVREFPRHPATGEALRAASQDPDADVRVEAGVALGREGRDVLLQAARGHGADDATTARAAEGLGPHLATAEAISLLRDALRTRREGTARAFLGLLARQGGPEAIQALARVLAVEKGPLAVAAAEALGETGDPGGEAALLGALAHAPEPVRVAAAAALGRVGGASAVPRLRQAEGESRDLRRAARRAIAEIQARLAGTAGASAGQLSLPEGEVGRVSLADNTSGRLSLPDEPDSNGSGHS